MPLLIERFSSLIQLIDQMLNIGLVRLGGQAFFTGAGGAQM